LSSKADVGAAETREWLSLHLAPCSAFERFQDTRSPQPIRHDFGGARGARVAASSRVVARGRARRAITARREVTPPAPLGGARALERLFKRSSARESLNKRSIALDPLNKLSRALDPLNKLSHGHRLVHRAGSPVVCPASIELLG